MSKARLVFEDMDSGAVSVRMEYDDQDSGSQFKSHTIATIFYSALGNLPGAEIVGPADSISEFNSLSEKIIELRKKLGG